MALSIPQQWTATSGAADAELITVPTVANWLVAVITARVVDGSAPVLSLADVPRNLWRLVASETTEASAQNTGAQLQAEVWVCPAARYDGWKDLAVYASAMAISADDVGSVAVNVFEVVGMTNGYLTVDAVRVATASAATSMSLSMPTPGADSLLVGVAATDNGIASAVTNTGAGFTALTQVSRTGPNLVMTSAWKESTAAETISWSSGATSTNWAAVGVAIRATGTAPAQPNANWPGTRFQIGLGYTMATPLGRVRWTDQTRRLMDYDGDRGIQAELGTAQQGQSDIVIRNDDGAYTPRTPGVATASGDGSTTALLIPDAQAGNVNAGDFFQLKNSTTAAPSPVFSDTFESGTLANWPTIIGNAAASTAAAYSGSYGLRINPGGGVASQAATSTTKWAQNTYRCAWIKAKLRYNALPTGTTADTFTLQDNAGADHFDFYWNNTTNTLWFDLKGAVAWTDTGITPVLGRWYDVQAIVDYGTSTYTAQVVIDGRVFPLLSSPGETASFVRSFHVGTSSTGKTFQLDVDETSVTVSTGLLSFTQGAAGLKENAVFQVTGTSSSGGVTTVTFTRADGTGTALAPTITGDQYAGIGMDLYMPYRLLMTWGGKTYVTGSGWMRDHVITYDGAHWSQDQAEAIDALEPLATSQDWSPLRGEIMRRKPYAYWPLDDPSGVDYAANISGRSGGVLRQTTSKFGAGTNNTATFGASTQEVDTGGGFTTGLGGDSGTGWQQAGLTTTDGAAHKGYALSGTDSTAGFPPITNGVTVFGVLLTTDITSAALTYTPTVCILRNGDPASGIGQGSIIKLSIHDSSGGNGGRAQVTVWDKSTHATTTALAPAGVLLGGLNSVALPWALTITPTGWTAYVDNFSWSGSANLVGTWSILDIGGEADAFYHGQSFNALHCHIALFDRVLTAGEIAQLTFAAQYGLIDEQTNERIQRHLDTAGWRGGRALSVSQIHADTDVAGSDTASAISDVAEDEDGQVFIDAGGAVQFRSRTSAYYQVPRATLGENTAAGEIPYQPGLAPSYNPSFIYNTIQVDNAKFNDYGKIDTTTVVAVDDGAVARYRTRSLQRATRLRYLEDAWHLGWWLLARYAYPAKRVEQVTVEASADPTRWAFVLGVEVGDLLIVQKRPLGAPAYSFRVRVLRVQPRLHWSHDGQITGSVVLTLAAAPPQVPIAGDSSYGTIGTTVMGA